jgi:hypothetical protein
VKGSLCSSLQHISSTRLLCIVTHIDENDVIVDEDITLITAAATVTGTNLQPLTVALSASKRPVLSQISQSRSPFIPYALSVPLALQPHQPDTPTLLYWSDIGANRVYRCTTTGSDLAVVVSQVCMFFEFCMQCSLLLLLFTR